MRVFFIIPCFFTLACLLAQSKSPDYSKNQYNNVIPKAQQADCYVRKYDAGTSALRRGDYRAALRLFEEAKTCTEARSSSRRLKELETRIAFCNAQLGRSTAADAEKAQAVRRKENIELTGRKFYISAALTRNTDPNCFQLTVKEADRAFRDSCWDDAAKLYRAAKNCADANQTDREKMNNRIESCRASAEDELLQKEQKAVRTARHAIAANRADDAMDFLRQGNRSLAWRLADFANIYIAPDDNADCLETMYRAYFYEPPAADKISLRPPFCYQLSEDFDLDVQYRFTKNKKAERLIAFFPKTNSTLSWELPSLRFLEAYSVPALNNPIGFDVSPSGDFLFYGYNYYYLPNDQFLQVPAVTRYCFSEKGDLFFYEDVNTGMVHVVNLDQSARIQQQPQQQRKGANNIGRISPQPTNFPVSAGLQTIQEYKGDVWLGYADRVEVISRNSATGDMEPSMTWLIMDSVLQERPIIAMHLYPETREAIIATEYDVYYYFLNLDPNGGKEVNVVFNNIQEGRLLAHTYSAAPLLSAISSSRSGPGSEIIRVHSSSYNVDLNTFLHGTGTQFTVTAAISDNGDWLVTQDNFSSARLWALRDTCFSPPKLMETDGEDLYSRDGNRLYSRKPGSVKVYDADDLDNGEQEAFETAMNASLPLGVSSKWVVFIDPQSKLCVRQLDTKQSFRFSLEPGQDTRVPYAFDDNEGRFFAYSPGNGQVVAQSLSDGSTIDTRQFGGQVTLIRSIAGTEKLLVVVLIRDGANFRYSVKVWDIRAPLESPRVVRLQGYSANLAVVSEQGDRMALCNGQDIRIFRLDNLDDESIVIKPAVNAFINDIAFRPDGLALVSGDSEGNVGIWDVVTGQPLLRFSNVWEGMKYPVDRLMFAYGGTHLRVHSPGRLFTINLDAYTLRDWVQSKDRWLASFTSEQIRDYNLEIAFKYPGNFDRLAESGDFPLIRSFFQYFRDQSISSNNMEQVRTYCERASSLFELLDANGQGNLAYTMFEMYENYIMKLLLRNEPEEASQIVMQLEKRFDRPDVALLTAAYCSTVRHDLPAASRLYTDYLLRLPDNEAFPRHLESINSNLSQFQEYGLLDTAQITCLCEVFQQFESFNKLCPPGKKYQPTAYSKQVLLFHDIFHDIDSLASDYEMGIGEKVRGFEKNLARAATIEYPNPVVDHHPLEAVVLALSRAYLDLAVFEQNSPKTPIIYKKTVDLLEKYNNFDAETDSARLGILANAQLLWGIYLAKQGNIADAQLHYNAGLTAAKKLSGLFKPGTLGEENINRNLMSPIHFEWCKTKLLEGKPAEARREYELANQYLEPEENAVLLAYAALLEGNEAEAFIEFGDLAYGKDVGEALFQMDYMADLLPAHRTLLEAVAPRLKAAFLQRYPEVSPLEIDYWQALLQMNRYAVLSKWDSTLAWSTRCLDKMDHLMADSGNSSTWRGLWISQRIYQSYYLLNARLDDAPALAEVIRYSLEALEVLAKDELYYGYEIYIQTNLAHAYLLRNQSGDKENAIALYRQILRNNITTDNTWELLLKDFRDLHRAGIRWPGLKNLILELKPTAVELTSEDWQEMGG